MCRNERYHISHSDTSALNIPRAPSLYAANAPSERSPRSSALSVSRAAKLAIEWP